MISKTNKGATIAQQIKSLKQAIKKGDEDPFLYKSEELIFMKRSLRRLKEVMALAKKAQNGGFGYDV